MVSHSSYTNHEFLILVIQVINVSFTIKSFVTYKKGLVVLHMKRIFLLLVMFLFFNMVNLLQVMRSSAKNMSGKCDQNPQKHS